MKKLFGSPILVFVIILVLTLSCSDDESGIPGKIVVLDDNRTGFLFVAVGTAVIHDDEIVIRGQDAGMSVSIIIREQDGVGSYDVMGYYSGPPKVEVSYLMSGDTTLYSSLEGHAERKVGSVVLTEFDEVNKTISGQFDTWLYGKYPIKFTGSFTRIPY